MDLYEIKQLILLHARLAYQHKDLINFLCLFNGGSESKLSHPYFIHGCKSLRGTALFLWSQITTQPRCERNVRGFVKRKYLVTTHKLYLCIIPKHSGPGA